MPVNSPFNKFRSVVKRNMFLSAADLLYVSRGNELARQNTATFRKNETRTKFKESIDVCSLRRLSVIKVKTLFSEVMLLGLREVILSSVRPWQSSRCISHTTT